MSRPIGYYTSFDPVANEGLLAEMVVAWGAQFQELNNAERLWMITKLAEDVCAEVEEDIDESVEQAMERMDELSVGNKLGLILALINQVRGL
ncbi:MAG: hypothetical protein F6K28_54240 [Microcoleus sp. SIO2G3]|nr:hypothetical protein [Microcoleus sp. SIO2G3]